MVIKIVKKRVNGQDVIGPENLADPSNNLTRVPENELVTFEAPDADKTGKPEDRLTITFKGPSPFGNRPVEYGIPLKVVAGPGAVFKYSCKMKIGGRPFSSESGGEMEIIPA